MEPKTSGNMINHIKRQAKKIRKETGIPHIKALDQAALDAGYANWKNFLNRNTRDPGTKERKILKQVKLPTPLVLPYRATPLSKKNDFRPNTKMSISTHKELGGLLKQCLGISDRHKKVRKLIDHVRSTLEDWLAKEYKSQEELPDETFFNIYYGDTKRLGPPIASEEQKDQFTKALDEIKSIIRKHYHTCKPIDMLIQKLTSAVAAVESLPLGTTIKRTVFEKSQLEPGTVVYFKSNRNPAVVIRHDVFSGILECYADRGPVSALREEVSAYRDQSKARPFMPLRLKLPYGKWTCADGSEVIFNRDYCPIWVKSQNEDVASIDPDTEIIFTGDAEYYFDDGTAPWYGSRKKLGECLNILRGWGVEEQESNLMKLLSIAFINGDTSILKPRTRTKGFPYQAQ